MKKVLRKVEEVVYTDNLLVFVAWFVPTLLAMLVLGSFALAAFTELVNYLRWGIEA